MTPLFAQFVPFHQPVAADKAQSVDARMVGLLRSLLAISGLLMIYIDPVEPTRLVGTTYAALTAYCVYSVALCAATFYGRPFVPVRAQHWFDTGVYVCLIALTQGTNSIFFHFFFFAILVASFSRGFGEGFAVTLVSTALFIVVGFAAAPSGPEFELDRALIRPVYLFLLGYMIAYWGGHEIVLRRRLDLLRDVSSAPNPRLGVDHAVTQNLWRLLEFFQADACVLVRAKGGSAHYLMYRVEAAQPQVPQAPKALTEQSAQALLDFPETSSVAWAASRPLADSAIDEKCRRIANLLETPCLATAPYRQQAGSTGRVYVASRRRRFSDGDAEFLAQVIGQVATAVDNLQLLDDLMASAAQLERARISRDIHDIMIQPYIGLKLAVEALHRTLDPGSPVAAQVGELLEMSSVTVEDLRGYAARLRSTEGWPAERLLSGLRDQIARYRGFYGIEVELQSDPALRLSDRIAGEVHQIVCEALANVYRHTKAKRAWAELRGEADKLLAIEVSNECDAGAPRQPFLPRSIAERAAALGGCIEVSLDRDGRDIVRVAIPL